MRKSIRLPVLIGLGLLVALSGVQAGEDPVDSLTISNPDIQKPTRMRERIPTKEGPGPIELPIVRPGPIFEPLGSARAVAAGSSALGNAALPGGFSSAGGGDASASVVTTERRLRKLIRDLDD